MLRSPREEAGQGGVHASATGGREVTVLRQERPEDGRRNRVDRSSVERRQPAEFGGIGPLGMNRAIGIGQVGQKGGDQIGQGMRRWDLWGCHT